MYIPLYFSDILQMETSVVTPSLFFWAQGVARKPGAADECFRKAHGALIENDKLFQKDAIILRIHRLDGKQ